MKISEYKDRMVETALETKEEWLKDNPEHPDMPMTIIIFRDDIPVATAVVKGDRDDMLHAARGLAYGLSAESMILINETYVASIEKNPITDEKWGPGEMQELAARYDGVKKGWVTDAVSVTGVDRDKSFFMSSRPFRIEEDDIIWMDVDSTPRFDYEGVISYSSEIGGYIIETLGQIMDEEAVTLPDAPDFLPEFMVQAESDMATMFTLMSRDIVEMMQLESPPGSPREEYIKEMLPKREATVREVFKR